MSGRLPPMLPPPSQALQATLNPSSAASATLAARTSLSHLTQSHTDNHNDYHQPEEDEAGDVTMEGDEPPKKKQKRNKPTLSCHECVDRKTKVSRIFAPFGTVHLFLYPAPFANDIDNPSFSLHWLWRWSNCGAGITRCSALAHLGNN